MLEPPAIRLLGLDFADLGTEAAAALVAARDPQARFTYLTTPNADHLVRISRQPDLASIYQGSWLRLLDSRVVARAAQAMGLPTPRVTPGSDLTALLLRQHLRPRERITIVGLRPAALPALMERCGLSAPAHYDPPQGFDDHPAGLRRAVDFVLDHPARFVMLAVGSPRQERLAAAIAATGRATGIGLCVGASLDFLAGVANRAPGWMQQAGLEWLHRLWLDPSGKLRRYACGSSPIFMLLARERLRAMQQMRQDARRHGPLAVDPLAVLRAGAD